VLRVKQANQEIIQLVPIQLGHSWPFLSCWLWIAYVRQFN